MNPSTRLCPEGLRQSHYQPGCDWLIGLVDKISHQAPNFLPEAARNRDFSIFRIPPPSLLHFSLCLLLCRVQLSSLSTCQHHHSHKTSLQPPNVQTPHRTAPTIPPTTPNAPTPSNSANATSKKATTSSNSTPGTTLSPTTNTKPSPRRSTRNSARHPSPTSTNGASTPIPPSGGICSIRTTRRTSSRIGSG